MAVAMALSDVQCEAADVTAAAFEDIYDMSDGAKPVAKGGGCEDIVSGDTWYSAWGADGTAWLIHDDGLGFDNLGGQYARHRLCRIEGDPNVSTDSFRGVNLNPGTLGKTMPGYEPTPEWRLGYSSSICEIDQILYIIRHDWSSPPDLWPPINSRIIKSTDGGKTWVNHLGQTNAPLPGQEQAMFPRLPWSFMTFIQYGKGGTVPRRDNLDRFVYLTSGTYLARVPRAKLPQLNKADFQFYKGDGLDGVLDSSWSNNPDEGKPARSDGGAEADLGIGNVVYDAALDRYVATRESLYYASGERGHVHAIGKVRFIISTAKYPWGPWKTILRQGIWGRAGWSLLLCNKFMATDGLKTWHAFCGEYKGNLWNYGFQYTPVYISTGRVDLYEAEKAELNRTSVASVYPSFSGVGYAGGFARPGDGMTFKVENVNRTGWHIVRIHYTSPATNCATLSVYVNGKKARRVKLSQNNCDYRPSDNWTDRSDIYYMDHGSNRIELRQDKEDDAAGVLIDYIAVSAERTHDEGRNIAPAAVATASSGEARNAIKGCVDGIREWTAAGGVGEWIKLAWAEPEMISKVVLYDRVDPADQVLGGTLSFSDGSPVKVGRLQNDGQAGTVVTFPARRVKWVKFTVGAVRRETKQAGLGEIEVSP